MTVEAARSPWRSDVVHGELTGRTASRTATGEQYSAGAPVANPVRGAWRRERHTVVVDAVDLPDDVAAPFAIFSESAYLPVPMEFTPHEHPLNELVWVQGGTMTIHLCERIVLVPEGHGMWIPAGTVHSGRTTARTLLSNAFFGVDRCPEDLRSPTAVDVGPLLDSLLLHLQDRGLDHAARLRAEAVVFDVLRPRPAQFTVRVPSEQRIAPITDALLKNPTDDRTLRQWADHVGLSERTVARLFRGHTGLSFLQWRQALRVNLAITRLASGMPVQDAAQLLGYAQTSTFIATFRRVTGVTPGAFLPRDVRNAALDGGSRGLRSSRRPLYGEKVRQP